jgi:hypothetical protein
MSDLQQHVDECEAAIVACTAAVESAEQKLKEADAEYNAAELATPKLTVVDLVKGMAAETRDRRAGLIP